MITRKVTSRHVQQRSTKDDDLNAVDEEKQMLHTGHPSTTTSSNKSGLKYRDRLSLGKKAMLVVICGALNYIWRHFGIKTQSKQSKVTPSSAEWLSEQKSRLRMKQKPPLTESKWVSKPPPTLKQMYKSRNCDSYLAQTTADGERNDSKLYTEELWAYFRKIWREQGGKDPTKEYDSDDGRRSIAPPDFVPPFKAGQTKDGKGRGIFATRDIKKGELTYGGSKHYIFFTSGHDYRKFLDVFDDETACDIMKFTWPQDQVGPNGEAVIWGPMDDNALQNDGGAERANTGCPPGKNCGIFDEYALRDIKRGEEILCDYEQFFSLDFLDFKLWKHFGL